MVGNYENVNRNEVDKITIYLNELRSSQKVAVILCGLLGFILFWDSNNLENMQHKYHRKLYTIGVYAALISLCINLYIIFVAHQDIDFIYNLEKEVNNTKYNQYIDSILNKLDKYQKIINILSQISTIVVLLSAGCVIVSKIDIFKNHNSNKLNIHNNIICFIILITIGMMIYSYYETKKLNDPVNL